MRWSRSIVVGLTLLAGALLVILTFRTEPIAVETDTVTSGPMRVTINAEGRTRVREKFVVSAPITSRLGRVDLSEGDSVKHGTLLAQLAPTPMDTRAVLQSEASLRAAESQSAAADAQVEQAKVVLEHAQRDRQRMEQLASTGTVAQQEEDKAVLAESNATKGLEASNFTARAAHFQEEAIRSALLSSRHDQPASAASPILLRSPASGKILRILQESERTVQAGTPLIEIGDPASLELIFDVLSTDAVKITPGDVIVIENWGSDRALSGHVRTVEPSAFTKISALGIEEQRVNVIGDFDDPAGPLGDAYRVEGRIVIWQAPAVIRVPLSALFRSGKSWSVFTVNQGMARLRPVQIDHRSDQEAEVVSGIQPGDVVVRYPNDNLKDGMRVKLLGR